MTNDFIVGRPPAWPAGFGNKETLTLVLNVLLVAGCIAIVFQQQGSFAAFLIAALIFIFSFIIRYIPVLAKSEPDQILWSINAYKTLALTGGSLIVAVYFLRNNSTRSGKIFLVTGTTFLSLFLSSVVLHTLSSPVLSLIVLCHPIYLFILSGHISVV